MSVEWVIRRNSHFF